MVLRYSGYIVLAPPRVASAVVGPGAWVDLRGLDLVSYYPGAEGPNPWTAIPVDTAGLDADLGRIATLHANAVRLVLGASIQQNQDTVSRFVAVTRKAKEILAVSDAEWQAIAPLAGAPDAATLKVYRDRYREGIPRRPIAEEEADARALFGVLAAQGGPALVGGAVALAPGTFFRARPGG